MAWQLFSPTAVATATILNVKDYGAMGDNSTDDLTALTNAINAANAAGVSGRGVDLWFPAGVYKHSAQLPYLQNNVTLRGSGWQSTILMATFTTGDIIRIGNGTGHSGSGLMNMSVWCSGARTTGASIDVNHCDNVLIQNFVINECFQGILVQGASIKVWIDQGQINNVGVTTGVGIQVTNGLAGDTYIRAVVMTAGHAAAAGIAITQSGHFEIINCNVSGTQFGTGLLINPTTSQDVTYGFIEHSLFDSCLNFGMQINPTAAASARVRSLTFIDSWFSGCTGAASQGIQITLANSAIVDGLTFSHCRVLNNQGIGVSILAGQNINFHGCTIAGNSAGASNTLDGIAIAAGVSNIKIRSNEIGQAGTAGNTQRYAVSVVAGASANLEIIGNDCEPNGTVGTNGYVNLGALTGGGNIVRDNQPAVWAGDGSSYVGTGLTITATETALHPVKRYQANAIYPGTSFHWVVTGSCTVTSAAAVPGKFVVRMGTNGVTPASDTAVATFLLGTSAGVSGPILFTVAIDLTCRTVGAAATFIGYITLINAGTTGIFTAISQGPLIGTMATVASTSALYVYLTFGLTGSANVSCTFGQTVMTVEGPGNNN